MTEVKFNVGDILVAKERICDKGVIIKPGKEITISHYDDVIMLPSPSKWKKK